MALAQTASVVENHEGNGGTCWTNHSNFAWDGNISGVIWYGFSRVIFICFVAASVMIFFNWEKYSYIAILFFIVELNRFFYSKLFCFNTLKFCQYIVFLVVRFFRKVRCEVLTTGVRI